jgi:exocyst complex component 4
MELIDCLRS